jgi:hypothetical protein
MRWRRAEQSKRSRSLSANWEKRIALRFARNTSNAQFNIRKIRKN